DVAIERLITDGRVVGAAGVVEERIGAGGGVRGAGEVAVAIERLITVGRVVAAGGVVEERLKPIGRVLDAGGVAIERLITESSVAVCIVRDERIIADGVISVGVRVVT